MINRIKLTFLICLSYGFCAIYFNTCTSNRLKFSNPILAEFYPDPSICQADSDFYLVNSIFAYFPGIPVFHSRDLVNWKLLGHVLARAEQLNLDSLGGFAWYLRPGYPILSGNFLCDLHTGRRGW